MAAAATPLPEIPSHIRLRDVDLPFWEAIVRARERSEWNDVDLVVAGQLARTQYDIEQESLCLELEGTVIINHRGTQIANPRVSVLEQLARREMALMRTLQIGGAVAGGDKRGKMQGRQLQRQGEELRDQLMNESDDLLAR